MLEEADDVSFVFGGGVQRKKLRGSATGLVFVCLFVTLLCLSSVLEELLLLLLELPSNVVNVYPWSRCVGEMDKFLLGGFFGGVG